MSIVLYSFGRLYSTAETVMDSIHAHESLDGEQIHSKYGKIDDKPRHCARSSAEYQSLGSFQTSTTGWNCW